MKKTVLGALFALLLFLSVSWCVADALLGLTVPPAEVAQIPDFVGLDEDAAREYDWLEVVSTYRYDESPAGTVLSQEPIAGSRRKKSDRLPAQVRLTVSLGKERVTLPELTGTNAREAAETLRGMGLAVEEVRLPGGTAGRVIRTDPAAGTEIDAGQTVRLYVYAGENVRTVAVPSLVGMTRGEALLTVFRAGLAVGEESGVPIGTPGAVVTGQSPAAGSIVTSGSKIHIVLGESEAD